jgi:hypothetical protein
MSEKYETARSLLSAQDHAPPGKQTVRTGHRASAGPRHAVIGTIAEEGANPPESAAFRVRQPRQAPDSMDATLGVSDYTDPSRQVIAVDRFMPDRSYDPDHDVNDIALVHLKQATSVTPMRLVHR